MLDANRGMCTFQMPAHTVLEGIVFLSEMHVAHVIFLSMHCLRLRLEHAMRLLLRSHASVVVPTCWGAIHEAALHGAS